MAALLAPLSKVSGLMKRETSLTFYTRYGWLTPWVTLSMAGMGWVSLLFKKRSTLVNR